MDSTGEIVDSCCTFGTCDGTERYHTATWWQSAANKRLGARSGWHDFVFDEADTPPRTKFVCDFRMPSWKIGRTKQHCGAIGKHVELFDRQSSKFPMNSFNNLPTSYHSNSFRSCRMKEFTRRWCSFQSLLSRSLRKRAKIKPQSSESWQCSQKIHYFDSSDMRIATIIPWDKWDTVRDGA